MSAKPLDSNNTSDPAHLRSSPESLHEPSINATSEPTPPAEEESPKRLSKDRRSETVPITVPEGSGKGRAHQWLKASPPLSERDSIFATIYTESLQSPPPQSTTETSHNGKAEQSLGGPSAGKVKTSPRASRKQTQVTFAESPETRYRDRKKAEAYNYEVHELLKDSPAGDPADHSTSMGIEDNHIDTHRRHHHPTFSQQSSTSPHHYNFDAIDEDERARYRSWRAGNAPWIGSGAVAKRRSRSGDNTHVDKNIEATLPKFNQPVTSSRSRKSSQYLGLFKEKDVAEEKQKRHQRAKENVEVVKEHDGTDQTSLSFTDNVDQQFYAEPEPLTPSTTTGTYQALSHGGPRAIKELPVRLPRSNTETFLEAERTKTSPVPIQKVPQSLSSRLVEEMKQRHDIELSSDSERLLSRSFSSKRVHVPSPKVRTPVEEYTEYIPRRESDESAGKSPLSDEDEGSDHEQISKALYYPHRQIISDEEALDSPREVIDRVLEDANIPDGPLTPRSEQKLIEATERAANEVELSLETADETEHFHGQLTAQVANANTDEGYTSLQDISSSEYETADETSRSNFYDSSSSDEAGSTPKASPKLISTRKHHHQPTPLGAVELTPYDHQVGGHSTVYRFSRRAICKQLNNRENIFYETVEREHPELVTFMPRYIGVLNVTYRKSAKRRKTNATTTQEQTPSTNVETTDAEKIKEDSNTLEANGHTAPTPRIVSHSQQITPVPQVVLEHNRHIIPNNLFRSASRPHTPRPQSSDPSLLLQMHRWQQNGDTLAPPVIASSHSAEVSPSRPPMKQQSSWGATTVNTRLKEQVLREVFSPPQIHRHRRGRHHRSLSNTRHLYPESNQIAGSAPISQNGDVDRTKHASFEGTDSLRRSLLRGEHERHGLVRTTSAGLEDLSPPGSPSMDPQRTDNTQSERGSDDSVASEPRRSRRRHSGGGLTRRLFDLDSGKRSFLEFHEEEAGYGGDGEEEIFSMDDDASVASSRHPAQSPPSEQNSGQLQQQSIDLQQSGIASLPTPPAESPNIESYGGMFEPNNPMQALVDKDERVQLFILLEDLTAGMSKPCVLDLKMGTRQYGVEANQKKKRSQRQKCQNTTSQQLGVRVCGMQIFNVKTQSVVFKDKYYGRDLKAGREFQEALKGFFFDGYGYSAALKHIPLILEKISSLETMIRELPGYRFYASSLLMLYDRAASDEARSVEKDYSSSDKKSHKKLKDELRKKAEIKLKIVDFANCVTAEDPPPPDVPCPPHDPDGIDRGYLRGLRSLRLYFQRIWQELNEANFMDRGELEGMTMEHSHGGVQDYEEITALTDDEGNVSF